MSSLMEPIARIWSRRGEGWKYHWKNAALLQRLAELTLDDASLYSAEFQFFVDGHGSSYEISYSLSLCKGPNFHVWCRQLVPSSTLDVCVSHAQSWIGDPDFPLRIVVAVGRIPGLAHVKFSFVDSKYVDPSSRSSMLNNADRLLPTLLDSLRSSSVLKQIVLDIQNANPLIRRQIPSSDVLTLPVAIPSLDILEISETHHLGFPDIRVEIEASRIASFLRTKISLKSLRVTFKPESLEQGSAAVAIVMKPLTFSKVDAAGSSRYKKLDFDLYLVLSSNERDREFLVKAATSLEMPLAVSSGVCGWSTVYSYCRVH